MRLKLLTNTVSHQQYLIMEHLHNALNLYMFTLTVLPDLKFSYYLKKSM